MFKVDERRKAKFEEGTQDMWYEVVASRYDPNEFRVEAINHPPDGDGECYVTIFSGPNSKERAEEYAALKNAKVAVLVG